MIFQHRAEAQLDMERICMEKLVFTAEANGSLKSHSLDMQKYLPSIPSRRRSCTDT